MLLPLGAKSQHGEESRILRGWSRIFREAWVSTFAFRGREKPRTRAAFRWLRLDCARLGGGCERLHVPELGQERELIVAAAT